MEHQVDILDDILGNDDQGAVEVEEIQNPLLPVVKQSGLPAEKQNLIAETLGSFFNKAAEWDATIQSIVINDASEVGKMKMAREGRLTLRSMRLEAEKLVKGKREEVKFRMNNDLTEDKLWLRAGQMIDVTFKNLETKLEEKEKFAEIQESKRQEKLRAERSLILSGYNVDCTLYDLGAMPEQQFKALIQTQELLKKQAIEAEQARIAKEQAEAEERERIRLENERLKKEAEEREKKLIAERKKIEADKKAAEEKLIAERKKVEEEKRLLQEKAMKAEAELLAKKEAELKAQREVEIRAKAEEKARKDEEKRIKSAPDKEKIQLLKQAISEITLPKVNSDEAKKIVSDVAGLLSKVQQFIDTKIKDL